MAKTIEQIQAIITNKGDAREIINEIADYLQANPGGGSAPYLVYTALLSQSGTDVPAATVLENTIGSITPIRYGVGNYSLQSSGLFTIDKTYIEGFSDNNYGGTDLSLKLHSNAGSIRISLAGDGNEIYINTYDNNDLPIEWSSILGKICFPEIRVYP